MKKRNDAGFTLLELSIVLVIIGAIIGGILLGKTLLVSARIKTVMTDADSYITAIGNFKQQYQALPGDMANATSLWGTDSNGCPSGGGASGTCNGNGDGMIGPLGSGTEDEQFRAWQHLYYAGMFHQLLDGVATSGGAVNATPDINIPSGSLKGSAYAVGWLGMRNYGDASYYPGFYGHVLTFGQNNPPSGPNAPILTTDQAQSIDSKLDDGIPATGKIRTFISTAAQTPNCTTTAVASTAQYNVSNSGVLCSILFVTGF